MTAIAGNSLLALSRAISAEIGPFAVFTTTSNGADATHAVSTAMKDSEAPTGRYAGYYLNTPSSTLLGEQRVKRNGFTAATGDFTTASTFASTPQTGTEMELRGTMPHTDRDGLTGIRTCVNRALRKLWIRYRYPLTAVDGQSEYDLGALWWASRKRFLRLIDPDPGGNGHPPIATQSWDVVQSGETWTLELASAQYPSGDTFWLEVEAPANARLYISGAWANQSTPTAGLVLDADACLGQWNVVYQCALYECMRALSVQAGGARKAYWLNELEKPGGQAHIVGLIKEFEADQDSVTLGEGPHNNPAGWSSVVGDHGFWGR